MKFIPVLLIAVAGIFVSVSLGSCSKNKLKECKEHSVSPCREDPAKTNIRVKNNSKHHYCNVTVTGADGTIANYGSVKKGETTCYNIFEEAYRYAYITLYIDGEEYTLQPIDYVGEVPLAAGKFTYSLDVNVKNRNVYLQTIQD